MRRAIGRMLNKIGVREGKKYHVGIEGLKMKDIYEYREGRRIKERDERRRTIEG